MPYLTPTIDLFFYAPCYIKLISNLHYYFSQPLEFTDSSKYPDANDSGHYPIGLLDDVEIHFLHYKDKEQAHLKWSQRIKRVNYDRLFFVFTDKDLCDYNLIQEFDMLDIENKIIFTSKYMPEIKSSIYIPYFKGKSEIGNLFSNYHTLYGRFNFRRFFDK